MPAAASDLVCFSHLAWDHVFQRPHHLLTRAARDRRVVYVEEPQPASSPGAEVRVVTAGITVVTPRIPDGLSEEHRRATLGALIGDVLSEASIAEPVLWYYTPLALPWTDRLSASAIVYDCMDELSAFRAASPEIPALERRLLSLADVVFTGGRRLFEAKRRLHPDVHAFPSAVDIEHFRRARVAHADPPDQAAIAHPRLGWFGVIDERFDIDLVAEVARSRPDWSIVLVGPVAKIDPASLPRHPNIHHLGPRPYADLPSYLAGWDVAIMPFARNESTAFISPTKTPEYLAGGRPVVSTSIADVVRPYGAAGLVRIADRPDDFVAASAAAMAEPIDDRLERVDRFLAGMSWDRTWAEMDRLVARAVRRRDLARTTAVPRLAAAVPAASARRSATTASVGAAVGARGRSAR